MGALTFFYFCYIFIFNEFLERTLNKKTIANRQKGKKKMNNQIAVAQSILGADKVYSPEIVCPYWRLPVPEKIPPLRYTEDTLRQIKKENDCAAFNFYLWYQPEGLSFRRQHELRGIDPLRPPYFHRRNYWWLKDGNKRLVADVVPASGFYLFSFCNSFPDCNWREQESEIGKLSAFERTNEIVFLAALQTVFMHTGSNMASNRECWGKLLDVHSFRIFVVLDDSGGARIERTHTEDQGPLLCTSLCLKYDF
jgi:hypothetical protein